MALQDRCAYDLEPDLANGPLAQFAEKVLISNAAPAIYLGFLPLPWPDCLENV